MILWQTGTWLSDIHFGSNGNHLLHPGLVYWAMGDHNIWLSPHVESCWYIRDYLSSHMFALCIYCICSLSSKLRSLRIPLSKACAIFDWILDSFSDLSPRFDPSGPGSRPGPMKSQCYNGSRGSWQCEVSYREGFRMTSGESLIDRFFSWWKEAASWLPTVSRHLLLALLEIRC